MLPWHSFFGSVLNAGVADYGVEESDMRVLRGLGR